MPTQDKPLFAPSLMCLDIKDSANELEILNRHCDLYHVDIMDGHFVKNITLSVDFVKAIRGAAELPMEAHLMVTDPDDYIESLAEAGVNIITVHAEVICTHAFRTLRNIRNLGCKTGVCLCPATPLENIKAYLDEIDVITIMTVDPGYAGQQFIPQMVEKVKVLEDYRQKQNLSFLIQCDGAIGIKTYKPLFEAGARAFVMGSSGLYFVDGDLEGNCKRMKREFEQATGVKP